MPHLTPSYDPREDTLNALPFEEMSRQENQYLLTHGYPVKTYRAGPGVPTGVGPTTYYGNGSPRPGSGQRVSSGNGGGRKARPTTAPVTRSPREDLSMRSQGEPGDSMSPKFLGRDGRWVQDRMPMPIAESQAQPLTATATFMARLPGHGKPIRPVSAVVSYNDVSPVATTEYIRETLLSPGADKGFTNSQSFMMPPKMSGKEDTSRYLRHSTDFQQPPSGANSSGNNVKFSTPRGGSGGGGGNYLVDNNTAVAQGGNGGGQYLSSSVGPQGGFPDTYSRTSNDIYGHPGQLAAAQYVAEAVGNKVHPALKSTVAAAYSRRVNATNLRIGTEDLARTHDKNLGMHVVPGSPNARLVGGRWRHIPRPVEGDVLWTDYYGPYGKEKSAYYGRQYHDVSHRVY